MNISAFFPAYNEEGNIEKIIFDTKKALEKVAKEYEIIIVLYEGSKDNTRQIVEKLQKKDDKIKLIIQNKKERGYGTALRLGYKHSKYEWVFYTDSDNQFDVIKDLPRFVKESKNYKIVVGHRKNRQDPLVRIMAAGIYNLTMKILFFTRVRDVDCAFKLISRDVLDKIELNSVTGIIDTEILVKAKKAKFKIKELAVEHLPRHSGVSTFETAGSLPKMSTIVGLIKELRKLVREVYFK